MSSEIITSNDLKTILNRVVLGDFTSATVLFDNDSQALSGAVTLSESAANFDKLEICFRTNDGFYDSVTVCHPNGKKVVLTSTGMASAPAQYLKTKVLDISGTTINTYYHNNTTYYTGETRVGGTYSTTIDDYIAVTQVIGYRTMNGSLTKQNITISTSTPTSSDGNDGDIWFKYTAS